MKRCISFQKNQVKLLTIGQQGVKSLIRGQIMKLYGLKTCDTCRKAMRELKETGAELAFIDVRADGVAPGELARFHREFGDKLVNRGSATWRGLTNEQREKDPLALLQEYPALMKRPVIERDGQLYLGWGAEVRAALLG
jgi:arsenate reductase